MTLLRLLFEESQGNQDNFLEILHKKLKNLEYRFAPEERERLAVIVSQKEKKLK